jgi:hypothetical protein
MTYQRLGGVSRRCFVRALRAGNIEIRTQGGDVVIVFPGHHRRLGGRRGVGPLLLQQLLDDLAMSGVATDEVWESLRGKHTRQRSARPQIADERAAVARRPARSSRMATAAVRPRKR